MRWLVGGDLVVVVGEGGEISEPHVLTAERRREGEAVARGGSGEREETWEGEGTSLRGWLI
jgi:hypothetical protein